MGQHHTSNNSAAQHTTRTSHLYDTMKYDRICTRRCDTIRYDTTAMSSDEQHTAHNTPPPLLALAMTQPTHAHNTTQHTHTSRCGCAPLPHSTLGYVCVQLLLRNAQTANRSAPSNLITACCSAAFSLATV